MSASTALCIAAEISPGTARGFDCGVFAVGTARGPLVYANACPHLGVPLDWAPDRFLSLDGIYIICGTHGAEFRIDTGECISGPCRGKFLTAIAARIDNGMLVIASGGQGSALHPLGLGAPDPH
jgi:nitrite reductase/ring-hydroxylating ferredoxin subunit